MTLEPADQGVSAELSGGAFAVKRVVFTVGTMSDTVQRLLRKRLRTELDAVRDLIRKAETFPGQRAGGAGPGQDGRLTATEPQTEAPMEVDGTSESKRIKISSLVLRTEEPKRTTPDERKRLAERLASLAAALPDHVVAFLQNASAGDADYRRDGSETEMDTNSMMTGGALFHLKLLLDKFAPESTPNNQGRAALDASGVSCLSQHRQDASGSTGPVEKEGSLGVCGGASRRVKLGDIAEEYSELVGAIGVLHLSPLPRKLVDLAEHDEYVDICGDASPIVFPAAKDVEICSSPSSSDSDSGASSSDSDTSSSEFDSAEVNAGSPTPPPVFRKVDYVAEQAAQTPKPAPEKVQIAEVEEFEEQWPTPTPTVRAMISSPPPLLVPSREGDIFPWPPASAQEVMQIAKPDEPQSQRTVPVPAVRPIISIPSAPSLALPKENGTSAQPPATVHNVDPEELQDQRAAVTAPTERPINGSPPAPVALPNHNQNDTSAQPPAAADAEHIVIADPEQPQAPSAAPALAPDDPLTNLIAKAQNAIGLRRQEERNRAREEARRVLLEVERTALPDERIHPLDMEQLGIAAFEHIVSTVEGARTARPGEKGLRATPGCPTVMQFLGLFLKADGGSEEQEQEQPPGGGADMDVEEGEIR